MNSAGKVFGVLLILLIPASSTWGQTPPGFELDRLKFWAEVVDLQWDREFVQNDKKVVLAAKNPTYYLSLKLDFPSQFVFPVDREEVVVIAIPGKAHVFPMTDPVGMRLPFILTGEATDDFYSLFFDEAAYAAAMAKK